MKPGQNLNRRGPPRLPRPLLLLLAAPLLATIVRPPPSDPGLDRPADAVLTAVPVPLDEDDPARRRLGPLVFLRGWNLSASDRRFGGISAMQIEGDRVTAISDAGTLFSFRLPRAAGQGPLRVEPLPRAPGTDKRSYDTEALQLGGDRVWIAFERGNAIARYRRGHWQPEAVGRPRPMRRWLRNSGPEALVRLSDGRFLVFSEGGRLGPRLSPVVLFDGDPADPGTRAHALRYRRPDGYRVTDAALLPDGRLLVLNRSFTLLSGFTAKLVLVEMDRLDEGAVLEGREIADFRPPLTVDNLEALAVSTEDGRTRVSLASDDNFMGMQRTLLLEFALDPARLGGSRP